MRSILCLSCALGLVATAAAAEPVGFMTALKGDVQVASRLAPGAQTWLAARQDGPVEVGDRIRTGEGASVRIVLVDDTMLHVAEDTELEIQSYHVGAAATRERSVVRQTRGRLRAVVGDAFGGSTRLEVHTPTAVVGVKGTDFETREDGSPARPSWRCCLHAGGIRVSNARGAASPRPGFCVRAEQGKAPGAEFANPDAPWEAPDDGVEPQDFEEEVVWLPGLPPDADPMDDDDLRQLDVPDVPAAPARSPINPPGFSVGPLN